MPFRPAPARRSDRQTSSVLLCLLLSVLVLLGGCVSGTVDPVAVPSPADPAASAGSAGSAASSPAADHLTVIVVRAAERNPTRSDDPPLNAAGLKRARRLAERLADEPGTAVYVTPYQRTQSTGMPTANAWKVAPSLYDPNDPAAELATRVRADNPRGTVLVVGHLENTARIVAAFCSCGVDPIGTGTFGRLYRLTFSPDGRLAATERVENY